MSMNKHATHLWTSLAICYFLRKTSYLPIYLTRAP